jgi:sugar/nucleoside kinase (ribokinase family)
MPKTTLLQNSVNSLLSWLQKLQFKQFRVVVMPDFFFDRFVQYDRDFGQFSKEALEVVRRKGGSIDNVKQANSRGGNAANTAAALATLGASVYPIIETDNFGAMLLRHFLEPLGVNLTHVKTEGKASVTTALEFKQDSNKVNLMLRDTGSLADFGPKNLTSKDYQLLTMADVVCVFNWAGTHRYGTDLAETVFGYVKTKGKGKTYYDTADPTPNKDKIPALIKRVLLKDLVDVLSLNENEAVQYATYTSPKQVATLRKKQKKLENLALKCATILAEHLSARIDLHTTAYSATIHKNKKPQIVPSFKVKVLQATGAGDAWNAGNLYADQQGFSTKARLAFANAVAAYYVSNSNAMHPTLSQLKSFLKNAS